MTHREKDLQEALRMALDYIDAIPKDAVSRFPAMPGFDRDEVEALFVVEESEQVQVLRKYADEHWSGSGKTEHHFFGSARR